MTDVLERLREAAPVAFDGEPVAFAYLFGSHASGRAGPRSDIDVAVHLIPSADVDPFDLSLRLARQLERLAGVGPLDVVVLDEAPLSLAGRIQENHALLYCADEVQRVRYESLVARRYHDFKIHEQRSARERLARLAEG
jgi:uncharacterized protein